MTLTARSSTTGSQGTFTMDESMTDHWTGTFTAPDGCTHKTLFKHEYQRTNRVNRTKIVRCFPHCCPRHKPRSYCGTTILLSVSIPTHASQLHLDDLQVYARFRTEQSDAIRTGSRFSREFIHSSLQSNQHPTAEWVTGHVLSRMGSTWIFEINPHARWLYAWDSGATKAQRLTRHLLEAMVVAPMPRQPEVLQVLATVCSPTFTFVSFRRAADSDTPEPDQSLLFRASTWELQQRTLGEIDHVRDPSVHPLKRPLNNTLQERSSALPAKKVCLGLFPRSVVHCQAFLATLGLVLTAVGRLPATRFASTIPTIEADLYRLVFGGRTVDSSIEHSDAVGVAVRVVWWLHTDTQLRTEAHAHAMQARRWLGHPIALRQAYERWMTMIERRSEAFLVRLAWTWDDLGRALVTSTSPSLVRHAFDYQSFVATVRQHVVTSSHDVERFPWPNTCVWMCSLGEILSVRRSGIKAGPLDMFSFGSLVAFWTQLSIVRMAINGTHGTLDVSSVVQSPGSSPSRMRLVLDRRYRCFPTFPRGEPSLSATVVGEYAMGDYVGSIAYSEVGLPIVHVTLYAWPRDPQIVWAYRYICTLTTRKATMWLAIRVSRGHVEKEQLETLSLTTKLIFVKEWTSEYELRIPFRPAL